MAAKNGLLVAGIFCIGMQPKGRSVRRGPEMNGARKDARGAAKAPRALTAGHRQAAAAYKPGVEQETRFSFRAIGSGR